MCSIKAVLFDMDGVLVDSESVITEASIRALRDWGINAKSSDFHEFTGMGEDRFIGGVAEKYGMSYTLDMKRKAYEIYLTIVDDMIGMYPAAVPVLRELNGVGYRLVLASAADRIKVDANLRAAGIDSGLFCAILSGDDVVNKKPAPDVYLLAAEKAGIAPENCVVVEDALGGLAAAHAAGMRCICITTSFSEEILRENGAEYICADISGVPAGVKQLNGVYCY
jgi:HAD superfamily hydrolase (TIGR01509 family)